MKENVKLVVLIPVGGLSYNNNLSFIVDTIESVLHYTTHDRRVVIQDNSNPLHLGDKLVEQFPELTVVRAPHNYGATGGLYKALSLSMLHVKASYDFQVLLKIDTGALMTGYGLEDDAIQFMTDHPNVGEIGTYLKTGEAVEAARSRLSFETSSLGWLVDRKRCAKLRYYLQLARGNGYQNGEHLLGGASFYSPKFLNKLIHGDFLLREEISRSKLQENHLSALLCRASGLELSDFSFVEPPAEAVYQGAPRSPEEFVKAGAKLIHSTQSLGSGSEQELRAFFKARRMESLAVNESLKASIEQHG